MGPVGVVFDTNVLVSALGFGGTPLEALIRAFEDDVQLVVASETLAELDRVMQSDRLPFTGGKRKQYLEILRNEAEVVTELPELAVVERDPDDDMFLACAVGGNCQYVVSGDDHLLALKSFRGVEIVSPASFLDCVDDRSA
jgi:putative PIN family toxin of toxin-antitoxin system